MVGRALGQAGTEAESLLLKRSAIGLSVGESALTGAVSGALLKPTDDVSANSWKNFVADRAEGGLSGALSFSAMALTTHGWNKVAGSRVLADVGVASFLTHPIVSGIVSGAAGGVASLEVGSVIGSGKFNTDRTQVTKAASDMAVMGGLFGASFGLLGRVRGEVKSSDVAAPVVSKHSSNIAVNTATHDAVAPDEPAFDSKTSASAVRTRRRR